MCVVISHFFFSFSLVCVPLLCFRRTLATLLELTHAQPEKGVIDPHTHYTHYTHTLTPSASFLTKCLDIWNPISHPNWTSSLIFPPCVCFFWTHRSCVSLLFLFLLQNNFFLGAPENICNFHILFWQAPPLMRGFPFPPSYSLSYFFWFFAHFTCLNITIPFSLLFRSR